MKIGTKIVCWTDLHLGLRNNDRRHSEECLEFVKWMIQEAQEFGAKISIFGGDYHHVRSTIQTVTLNYSNQIFQLLDKNFDKHFQIVGNHDMFHKDRRDTHSVVFASNYKNIQVIDDITKVGDVVLAPFLVGNEYKSISKLTQPYIFGHFEFPHFMMNAMVAMPDVGHIKQDDFKTSNQNIFSGHFHKRQTQTNKYGSNITYLGNCFPHSFSDVDDDDRGIMLMELGKAPIFKKWPKAPKFRNALMTDIIADPAKYLDEMTTIKMNIDTDITFEEANFIKETLVKEYGVRELRMIPIKNEIIQGEITGDIKFETIDQIILESLKSIDSASIEKELLLELYQTL